MPVSLDQGKVLWAKPGKNLMNSDLLESKEQQ